MAASVTAAPAAQAGPLLIVAPHALDETLGCGGLMIQSIRAGRRVETLVLFGDRREEAARAAAILGAPPPAFAGLPENRSDTLALAEVTTAVERAVADLRPSEVFAPHGGSLHVDHQTASRAVATAVRPLPGQPVARLCAYEIPSSTEWAPPGFGAPFIPNRLTDVGDVLDQKLDAVDAYASLSRPWPHARSRPALEALARWRGAAVGVGAAEAFMVLRWIG